MARWFGRNQGRIGPDPFAAQKEKLSKERAVQRIWDSSLEEADYFVIDIETSGFSAVNDLVLSLAAGSMRGNVLPFDSLLYSTVKHENIDRVPERIWQLTGLTGEDIRNGEEWKDLLFKALEMSVNKVWIAHHARHELSFIERHVKQFWKIHLRPIVIDTATVAQVLCKLQSPPTLDAVCEWLGVEMDGRHRADADIQMTAEVWRKEMALCSQMGLKTVSQLIEWSISNG